MKRQGHTDAFNTGSYAQDQTREPMDKVTNRSRMKEANKMHSGAGYGSDGLFNALGAPKHMYKATHKANLPKDNLHFRHSHISEPTGSHYSPAGAFGKTHPTSVGSTHQLYGPNRKSAPSANAVGSYSNRRGSNAVGNPPNRSGSNAVGYPPHRHGQNAIGNPPNRIGENALASRYTPRSGGGGRGA